MPNQLSQHVNAFIERLILQAAVHYCHDGIWPETQKNDAITISQLLRELRKLRDAQGDSDHLRHLMSTLKLIRDSAIDEVLDGYCSSKDIKQPFNTLAERDKAFIIAHYLQKERGARFDKHFKTFAVHDRRFLQSLLDMLEQHRQHHLSSQELACHIAQEILTPNSKTLQAVRMHRWIETLRLAWPAHRHTAEMIHQGLQQAIHMSTALQYVAEPQQSFFKHFAGELLQHPPHSGFIHPHPPASSHPQLLAELLPGRHLGNATDNALIQHIHTLLNHEDGLATVAEAIDAFFKCQTSIPHAVATLYNPTIVLSEEAIVVVGPNASKETLLTASRVETSTSPHNRDRLPILHAPTATSSRCQSYDALTSHLQHIIIASVLQDSLLKTHFVRVDQWLQVADILKSQQKYYEAEAIVASLRIGLTDYRQEPFLPSDLKDDLKAHRNKAAAFAADTPGNPHLADEAIALAQQMMATDEQALRRSTTDYRQQLIRIDRHLYWREQLKNPALSEWLIDHPEALKAKIRNKHLKAYHACATRKVDSEAYRAALAEFMDTTALSKSEFDEIYRYSKQAYYHQLFENSMLREVLKSFHLSKQGLKTDFFQHGTEQHIQQINQAAHQPQSDELFRQHLANLGIVLAEKLLALIQHENHRLQRISLNLAREANPIQANPHRSKPYDATQAPTSTNHSPLSSTASESVAEEHLHNQLHHHNEEPMIASIRKARQDLL